MEEKRTSSSSSSTELEGQSDDGAVAAAAHKRIKKMRDVHSIREPSGIGMQTLFTKNHKVHDLNVKTSKATELDLNAADDSKLVHQEPFYPYKIHDHVKARDASECGSTTDPLKKKDPMKVWKEMKENGFLSLSHGGIPVPKQRERKTKNDLTKRIELANRKQVIELEKRKQVIELAKRKQVTELAEREQVNRFTKVAAPSGLLNGLNPGIINHIRNSKQVHSVIEALVRSEKLENGIQSRAASRPERGTKEINGRREDPETTFDSGAIQFSHSLEAEPPNTSLESRHSRKYHMPSNIPSEGQNESKTTRENLDVAKASCGKLPSETENEPIRNEHVVDLECGTVRLERQKDGRVQSRENELPWVEGEEEWNAKQSEEQMAKHIEDNNREIKRLKLELDEIVKNENKLEPDLAQANQGKKSTEQERQKFEEMNNRVEFLEEENEKVKKTLQEKEKQLSHEVEEGKKLEKRI